MLNTTKELVLWNPNANLNNLPDILYFSFSLLMYLIIAYLCDKYKSII